METLSVYFENCYGIKKLKKSFDFKENSTYAIYAPNGTMKSSFEKAFCDLSKEENSKDRISPDRKTIRTIQDENKNALQPSEVFTIKPYVKNFETEKLSTLLVSDELKTEYESIYKDLRKKQDEFIKKLKQTSQSTDCETEIVNTFKVDDKDSFFDVLEKIKPEIDSISKNNHRFKYNDVFDKGRKVKEFLEKNTDTLDEYVEKYNKLLSSSHFFSQSNKSIKSFGTYQAKTISDSVKDNSFFDAGHEMKLKDDSTIKSVECFNEYLKKEIEKVVDDVDLKKSFDKVDKAISGNVDLRNFKEVIEKDNQLLVKLKNYEEFRKETWLNFLLEHKDEVETLISNFQYKKKKIQEIVNKANDTQTEWQSATDEFNKRFTTLPFRLEMKNKEDVILKTDTPSLEFVFRDTEGRKTVEKKKLLKVLSQGEKKALYLLNIIFEIKAREKLVSKTVFVIDDIADSFDYQNKYAIIEYLKDISKIENFYQIILTHNFDFFRTISSRFGLDREHSKMINKTNSEIKIVDAAYLQPFEYFKKNLHCDEKIFLASIPFVRNIAEYVGKSDSSEALTSLLHIKKDTFSVTIKDLDDIYESILEGKSKLKLKNPADTVVTRIYDCADNADKILNQTSVSNSIDLESKIILSIAIRLKAEEFMISEIDDPDSTDDIKRNQTVKLIKEFKKKFPGDAESIDLLEQVNLMTPENIHLNSFMYEPILDMSICRLQILYRELKGLYEKTNKKS